MDYSKFINSEERYYGNYRAEVVGVDVTIENEPNDYGAIKVFIPEIMKLNSDKGSGGDEKPFLIAFPANTPLGGYNSEDKTQDSYFTSSCIVPPKNSWVWVFFEAGIPTRPFYGSAFKYMDKMTPSENRKVSQPNKVYTMIKTKEGRSLVVSDSPDCPRVQITGKKRLMTNGPEGDKDSVYNIDGNQNTILLSEIPGKEQILIKTYKGDFLNIDIEKGTLEMSFSGGIKGASSSGGFSMDSKSMDLKSGNGGTRMGTEGHMDMDSSKNMAVSSGARMDIKGKTETYFDTAKNNIQTGLACPAKKPKPEPPSSGNEGKI